jgi:hypothetical protein
MQVGRLRTLGEFHVRALASSRDCQGRGFRANHRPRTDGQSSIDGHVGGRQLGEQREIVHHITRK